MKNVHLMQQTFLKFAFVIRHNISQCYATMIICPMKAKAKKSVSCITNRWGIIYATFSRTQGPRQSEFHGFRGTHKILRFTTMEPLKPARRRPCITQRSPQAEISNVAPATYLKVFILLLEILQFFKIFDHPTNQDCKCDF